MYDLTYIICKFYHFE